MIWPKEFVEGTTTYEDKLENSVKTYTFEEMKAIYNKVLQDVEADLVHLVKHSKDHSEKAVAQLRVIDTIAAGIKQRLSEETK